MKKFTVVVADENGEFTTGTMNGECEIGDDICIDTYDENGVPSTAFGKLTEILEEKEF